MGEIWPGAREGKSIAHVRGSGSSNAHFLTLIQGGRRGFCAAGTAKGPIQARPGRNMGLAFPCLPFPDSGEILLRARGKRGNHRLIRYTAGPSGTHAQRTAPSAAASLTPKNTQISAGRFTYPGFPEFPPFSPLCRE
jgi:hypothetical protein